MSIRVRFTTKNEKFVLPSSDTMMLPFSSHPQDLNILIKHLLHDTIQGELPNFDFRIDNKLLTGEVGSFITQLSLSKEETIEILYEVPAKIPKPHLTIQEEEWIRSVAISQVGILTGSFDKLIRLYLPPYENPRIFKGSSAPISALKWINSESFVAGSADGSLKIWSISGNLMSALGGLKSSIQSIAILDDKYIAAAEFGGNIAIYDLENMRQPGKSSILQPTSLLKASNSTISTISFQGNFLYSFDWDGVIKKFHIPDHVIIDQWTVADCSITFSDIQDQVATIGLADGSIIMKDLKSPSKSILVSKGGAHDGWISGISFDPSNPRRFVSVGHDGRARIWDSCDLNVPIAEFSSKSTGKRSLKILTVDWRHDLVVFGGEDKTLHINTY